jgi:hypothetical protein
MKDGSADDKPQQAAAQVQAPAETKATIDVEAKTKS